MNSKQYATVEIFTIYSLKSIWHLTWYCFLKFDESLNEASNQLYDIPVLNSDVFLEIVVVLLLLLLLLSCYKTRMEEGGLLNVIII